MSSKKDVKTQILYGLILSLIFSIAITIFFSIESLISSSKWAAHSYLMIGRGNELSGYIYKVRHASRGFFLSGDKSYFEQYEQYRIEVTKFIADTKLLVNDNPAQIAILNEVNDLVEQLYKNIAVGIQYKEDLIAKIPLIQQHAVQQIKIFTEIKTLLNQLQSAMNQQKNHEAEILAINVLVELFNCEVSQKNLLFTGDEKFLDLYDTYLQGLEEKIDLLEHYFIKEFAKDNDFIRQVNMIKVALEKSKNLLKTQDFKDYTGEIIAFSGKGNTIIEEAIEKNRELMESVKQKIDKFNETERALSAMRDQKAYSIALVAQSVSIFGNFIIILLGIVAVIAFNRQNWLKSGHSALNEKMRGEQDIVVLTKNIISFVATYLKVKVGLFYLLKIPEQSDKKPYLQLISSYAYTPHESIPNKFFVGEGLIGEVALECKPVFHPADELADIIQSALVQAKPRYVLFMPVLFENALIGIFELGVLRRLKKIEYQFLESVTQNVGVALNTSIARSKMSQLLVHSQTQEKELLIQRDKLQQTNEELQAQAEELRSQEEELRQYNDDLEQRTHELEAQRKQIETKNQILEKTKIEVEHKARELETASKYKSEFLANMSHELRTPLNSILVLAQILRKNNEGNLTDKQIEHAQTIYQSGNDLLNLINDVLDLSKVEAGKMDIHLENVSLTDLVENVKHKFVYMAEGKGLYFQTSIADNAPPTIYTDAQRLNQIVTNLLANALKFTTKGTVHLVIERPLEKEAIIEGLNAEQVIALRVIDSGIGIPKSKQQLIFEAFQQADGSTSRHYGGTGLGLSISREFSKLLGGKLSLISEEGKGSTFTLYLPVICTFDENASQLLEAYRAGDNAGLALAGNTSLLFNKKVLIVDDDQRNSFVLTLMLDNVGMTTLTCSNGREALSFLEAHPDMDIVLMDIMMQDMDGYETIEKIRTQSQFEKLPIIAITAKTMVGDKQKCIEAGANDYLTKPVDNEKLFSVLQVWLA